MNSIEKTWEGVEQPHDEDTAGVIWFYTSTYRTIQEGLKLLLHYKQCDAQAGAELHIRTGANTDGNARWLKFGVRVNR